MGAVRTPAIDAKAMRRHAASAARVMKALANRHRLLVLCVLAEGEVSVGALNARVPLSQSALSQHLAVLRRERLVTTRRAAQTIFYRIADGVALGIMEKLHDHYCGARAAAVRRTGTGAALQAGRTFR